VKSVNARGGLRIARWMAVVILASHALAHAEIIRVGGTGAAGGIIRLLGAEFAKSHATDGVQFVDGLGSSGGLRALRDRAIQIAVVSRPLTESESRGMMTTYVASTPLVLAVRKNTRARSVTSEQLARIYDGSMTAWPDGSVIRLILRPRDDIDTKLLAGMSPGIATAIESAYQRKGMIEAATDDRAADLLEKTPGSLGPTTLGMILSESRDLAPLAIDGVEPSIRNLVEGKYRLFKVITMVTDPTSMNETTARFLKFTDTSAARAMLERTGHIVSTVRAPGPREPARK
jgi:phosphate transport system substrate-binding protein